MKHPVRGEVWLVDLGMTAKVRPCLIMSIAISDIDRALVTLVPHTTSTRATSFEASVPTPFLRAGAFDVQGLATVPVTRAIRLLGKLNQEQLRSVEVALCRWLDLPCTW